MGIRVKTIYNTITIYSSLLSSRTNFHLYPLSFHQKALHVKTTIKIIYVKISACSRVIFKYHTTIIAAAQNVVP